MRYFIFISLVFLFQSTAFSQDKTITVKYMVSDSGVSLRWYPDSKNTLQNWDSFGIVVERTTIVSNGVKLNSPVTIALTVSSIKGEQRDAFKRDYPGADFLFSVVEEKQNATPTSPAALAKIRDQLQNEMFYFTLLIQKDIHLAAMVGLLTIDRNTEPNSTYVYRLYSAHHPVADTTYLVIQTNTPAKNPVLPKPNAAQNENGVLLQWEIGTAAEEYYGCVVERSVDSGKSYSPLNETPLLFGLTTNGNDANTQQFLDTFSAIPGLLQYRLRGIDYFNNTSPPSDFVPIKWNKLNTACPQYLKENRMGDSVQLQWEYNPDMEEAIEGFVVYRGDSMLGKFIPCSDTIKPKKRSCFLHIKSLVNYYSVHAISKVGNATYSNPILVQGIDSVAPAAPINIHGHIDSHGVVQLQWKNNTESDFLGYQIYRSNYRNAEYSNLSATYVKHTFFRDTLNISWLRDSIFYCIVAFDKRYNESPKSDVLALHISNRIPPAATAFVLASAAGNIVHLQWARSSSTDVMHYHIYCEKEGDTASRYLWKTLTATDTNLIDSGLQKGEYYRFHIRALDQDGLYSKWSPPVVLHLALEKWYPAMDFTRIIADTAHHRVIFHWDIPKEFEVLHYRILASIQGKTTTLGTADGNKTEFIWHYLQRPENALYRIVGYDKEGKHSKW